MQQFLKAKCKSNYNFLRFFLKTQKSQNKTIVMRKTQMEKNQCKDNGHKVSVIRMRLPNFINSTKIPNLTEKKLMNKVYFNLR